MEENRLLQDKLGRFYHQHKYEHGAPDKEIDLTEFQTVIEKAKANHESKRYIAYTILLYWIGCRRSEPIGIKKKGIPGIVKEDIREENGSLFVKIPAFKHGQRGGENELPLNYYGIDVIKQVWQSTKEGRRIFPFTDRTGYNFIKKQFPNKTPHHFRHNRITKLRKKIDGKTVSVDDVKSWTGIKSDRTIQHYGMKTQEGIHRVANVLD